MNGGFVAFRSPIRWSVPPLGVQAASFHPLGHSRVEHQHVVVSLHLKFGLHPLCHFESCLQASTPSLFVILLTSLLPSANRYLITCLVR